MYSRYCRSVLCLTQHICSSILSGMCLGLKRGGRKACVLKLYVGAVIFPAVGVGGCYTERLEDYLLFVVFMGYLHCQTCETLYEVF